MSRQLIGQAWCVLEEWLLNKMKKHWKLALLGVVSYLVFLLVLTPASWWLRLAPLPAAVQLGPVTGTLWRGEIQQLTYQQLHVPALSWRLNPWALFGLSANFQLQSGSLQQPQQLYLQAKARATVRGITLDDTMLKLPVSSIMPFLQLPLPVQATGDLLVDIRQLQLNQQQCIMLQGQASWLDASLQPPTGTWLELKHIHASLQCEAGQPVLLTDPDNVLSLAIRATISAAGDLQVQGSLKPDASLPAEVHQAMRFVGQPDAQGRYTLNF